MSICTRSYVKCFVLYRTECNIDKEKYTYDFECNLKKKKGNEVLNALTRCT